MSPERSQRLSPAKGEGRRTLAGDIMWAGKGGKREGVRVCRMGGKGVRTGSAREKTRRRHDDKRFSQGPCWLPKKKRVGFCRERGILDLEDFGGKKEVRGR